MIYHLRNYHPFIQSHNPWFPSHESSHPKVANVSYKDPNDRNILHSGEAVAKAPANRTKWEQITSADRFLSKYIHRNMKIIKYRLVFLIICTAYPIISYLYTKHILSIPKSSVHEFLGGETWGAPIFISSLTPQIITTAGIHGSPNCWRSPSSRHLGHAGSS